MAADTLKAVAISNLDASPAVANNTGVGAEGYLKSISDYVTVTTGGLASTSSTYKMVRLPSNAKVKRVELSFDTAADSNASPTLAWDVGAYYSDSTVDGTNSANQGASISVNAFLANVKIPAATGGNVDHVNADSAFAALSKQQPLWQALALAADPGGFIDIVVAVHATAATAVSTNMYLEVQFVM